MSEKLRRRWLYSRGRFRLFGEPPNGFYIPVRIYQVIGGRHWSLSFVRVGTMREAHGRRAGEDWESES